MLNSLRGITIFTARRARGAARTNECSEDHANRIKFPAALVQEPLKNTPPNLENGTTPAMQHIERQLYSACQEKNSSFPLLALPQLPLLASALFPKPETRSQPSATRI